MSREIPMDRDLALRIMSLPSAASDTEIRKQYKKLALLWHPDKNKAKGAKERFDAIKTAYDHLVNHSHVDPDLVDDSNELSRGVADFFAENRKRGYAPGSFNVSEDATYKTKPFQTMYEQMYESATGRSSTYTGENGSRSKFAPPKPPTVVVLHVTLEDVFFGRVKSLSYGKKTPRGVENVTIPVTVPRGARERDTISIAGAGGDIGDGAPPIDLHVTVDIAKHEYLHLCDDNILHTFTCRQKDSQRGFAKEIINIDGEKLLVNIPPFFPNYKLIHEVKMKGMTTSSGRRGSLILHIMCED